MVSNSQWLLQSQEDRRHMSFCSTILSTWLPSCVTHTHTHTGLHTYLAAPSGLYPSSPTKGQTWAPEVKVPSPNHWTTREFPSPSMKCYGLKKKKKWLLGLQPLHSVRKEEDEEKGGAFQPSWPRRLPGLSTQLPFLSHPPKVKKKTENVFFFNLMDLLPGFKQGSFHKENRGELILGRNFLSVVSTFKNQKILLRNLDFSCKNQNMELSYRSERKADLAGLEERLDDVEEAHEG